jgi:ribokinase
MTESHASEAQRPVVVVGAINVDMVVSAETLPRSGETVVGDGPARHGGGKGANAALAAARAGAAVRLVGAVGRDETADAALEDLRHAGVDVAGVAARDGVPTGVALIVVDAAGENQIAVGSGANGALAPEWVADRTAEALASGAVCVLVSTEIPGEAVAAAVRTACAAGVTCVLNPAPPLATLAGLLDAGPLLTPNARELRQLTQLLGDDPERHQSAIRAGATEQALALARRTGQPVVVTLGGDGALVVEPDGFVQSVPAVPADVVDTTGAGDTFNGVLAARIAAGDALTDAVHVAVLAASISVSRAGARGGMPHRAELEVALTGDLEVAR